MTFAELLTEVYSITGRPDLVDLSKSSVKAATLKAHQTDFYSKDIYEQAYIFGAADYTQAFDVINEIPNYRALKYMRLVDESTDEAAQFITVITPEEVLDEWNRERTNVAYVAGRVIQIKASVEFSKILLGCYVLPVVVEASYSSWVADIYPYAIIHEAARLVFATIAMDAEKNSQRELVAEQYAELKINAVTDVGY